MILVSSQSINSHSSMKVTPIMQIISVIFTTISIVAFTLFYLK